MKELIKKVKRLSKKAAPVACATGVGAAVVAAKAHAGTDTTFDTLTTTIQGWGEGSLGKLMAIGTLLVGGGMAIMTQSLKTAISAVGVALALSYGPGVLSGLFTAVF